MGSPPCPSNKPDPPFHKPNAKVASLEEIITFGKPYHIQSKNEAIPISR
jgi:hypothetical protein